MAEVQLNHEAIKRMEENRRLSAEQDKERMAAAAEREAFPAPLRARGEQPTTWSHLRRAPEASSSFDGLRRATAPGGASAALHLNLVRLR